MEHRRSDRKCDPLRAVNGALDPRYLVPALFVLVGLSATAAQLELSQLEAYGALLAILAVSAVVYYGARGLVARR